MKYNWAFKLSIVIINLCLIFITVKYFDIDHKYNKQIDTTNMLKITVDSLKTELFNSNSIVGRYEITLEHLKEVNPVAAKEFENFLSHKTE